MEPVPNWSSLLPELVGEIAKRMTLIEDFMAFRGVCTSWRIKDCGSVCKVPLLMLSEKEGDEDVREFYSLSKNKISSRIPMPEAKGKKCVGAGYGWYLTIPASGGELHLVKLMNSSRKIQLPNMKTFPGYEEDGPSIEHGYMNLAALSANPSETSDFVLMVGVNMSLGFWRNGDSSWTRIQMKDQPGTPGYSAMCCYKHKMYAVDYRGFVWMWDPNLTEAPAKMLLKLHEDCSGGYSTRVHLVESTKGELLLTVRNSIYSVMDYADEEEDEDEDDDEYEEENVDEDDDEYEEENVDEDENEDEDEDDVFRYKFQTMKLDMEKGTYHLIKSLNGDAIFNGYNNGVAVAADDFPGVLKPNCIYFTDDNWEQYTNITGGGGHDLGIYNFEDESIERFPVESFSSLCPPIWVFQSL